MSDMSIHLQRPLGLALGAGAGRGWAHIGVLRALDEAGIRPAWVAGTSMGAVVGAAYATGKLDAMEAFARSLTAREVVRYTDPVIPLRGLLGGRAIGEKLTELIGDIDLQQTIIPLCIVATDLGSGAEVRYTDGSLMHALRAAIAIPGIFTPVSEGTHYRVDGGLVNPVPVSAVRDMGAQRVLAVDLNHDIVVCSWSNPSDPEMENQPEDDAGGFTDVAWKMGERLVDKALSGVRPNVFDVIGGAIDIIEARLTEVNLKRYPPEFLVQPALGHMRLWDFHEAEGAIAEGYRATRSVLEDTGHGFLR